jgi:hypothetical protein
MISLEDKDKMKSFLEYIAEQEPQLQPFIPSKRAATMQTRAMMNMARDEKRVAAGSNTITKTIDIQIASLKEKLARLQKRKYDIMRAQDKQNGQQAGQQGGAQTQMASAPSAPGSGGIGI